MWQLTRWTGNSSPSCRRKRDTAQTWSGTFIIQLSWCSFGRKLIPTHMIKTHWTNYNFCKEIKNVFHNIQQLNINPISFTKG